MDESTQTPKGFSYIRWQQRFENFEKAYAKLRTAISAYQKVNEKTGNSPDDTDTRDLIQMALIQSFEFTYELGWKTLKDYLKYNGIKVYLPREVIKEAFANNLIENGQAWIDMIEDRNLMSHTHDEKKAEIAIDHIINHYDPVLGEFYEFFKKRQSEQK